MRTRIEKCTVQNSFTTNVSEQLEMNNKTWTDLEAVLGVSRRTVRNWMDGRKTPSLNVIAKIAEFLKIADPKILLTDIEFSVSRGNDVALLIINDFLEKYKLENSYFKEYGIRTDQVQRVRNGHNVNYKILSKFANALKKYGVKNSIDLISFKSNMKEKKAKDKTG